MAESQGVSKSTVNNIWRAHKLQPHRTKTFKLSRDPKFLEKMTDVVGLYLNPPQLARSLGVDRDKVYSNIARYGNTSSGSMLIAAKEWSDEEGFPAGRHVVFAGFGVGFHWGALVARGV